MKIPVKPVYFLSNRRILLHSVSKKAKISDVWEDAVLVAEFRAQIMPVTQTLRGSRFFPKSSEQIFLSGPCSGVRDNGGFDFEMIGDCSKLISSEPNQAKRFSGCKQFTASSSAARRSDRHDVNFRLQQCELSDTWV